MAINTVDQHFLKIATALSKKDPRASGLSSRGCIIAHGNRIIATGVSMHLGGNLYKPEEKNEQYIATVTAELVALSEAVKKKADLAPATAYISAPPTWAAFKMLVTMGIKRIVCVGPMENERITHYASELGIELSVIG